jgi:hypothetical protein
MNDPAANYIGHGINADMLIALNDLGSKIATDRNGDQFAPLRARTRKITLTRGAEVSQVPMIEFRPYGNMEWHFGVQLGNLDRLWFCRNTDDDNTIYHFEDSIFPQEYSEQECIELIDHLETIVEGLPPL